MKDFKASSPRIALLVFPLRNPHQESGQIFLTELIDVLRTLSCDISVITGNYFKNNFPSNIRIFNVNSTIVEASKETIISKTYRFIIAQFRISREVVRVSDKIDIAFLFLSSSLLLLPTILLYLRGRKIGVIVTGSGAQSIERMYPTLSGKFFSFILRLIENFNYIIADRIIVYSPKMVNAMELEKYRTKVLSDGYRGFIDTERFRITRKLEDRENVVSYIGRLSAEKGVLELANAISIVLSKKEDIRFLVIGDGPLLYDLKNKLRESGCLNKVHFLGWIPNDMIPAYLNETKILILPSYTEGLPKIILEAMACGAIVLASCVGSVPDIVSEGETGFLLNENSPPHISNRILDVLDYKKLNDIQRNARALILEKYIYKKAVDRYRVILEKLR